jgi:hypothetical protein
VVQSLINYGTNRVSGLKLRNLRDARQLRALPRGDTSAVGLYAPRKNLEQRRFAGAIRADQADAVAVGNGE